jgi:hypothetical protein
MELLGDMGHVKSCFGPFGDNVSVSARQVHGLRQTYHSLWNCFVCGVLDDEAQVESRFSPFGDSANLGTRWVHHLRRTYHRLRNHFVRT